MEVLVHFVFTVFKISVLASVYAGLLLLAARLVAVVDPTSPFARAGGRPKRFWWRSGFLISVGLFVFSLTYWGNHGLGDYARIPLGHGEAVEEINGTTAYFKAQKSLPLSTDQPFIEDFAVADDVLCAQASDHTYFAYDLATKQHRLFADSAEYAAHARPIGLPAPREFASFTQQYGRYWGGWRFWLLA